MPSQPHQSSPSSLLRWPELETADEKYFALSQDGYAWIILRGKGPHGPFEMARYYGEDIAEELSRWNETVKGTGS